METLLCPGCNKPFFEVHKDIKGIITSSTFLDGANGFFSQSKLFSMTCPGTGIAFCGAKTTVGDNSIKPQTEYRLWIPEDD